MVINPNDSFGYIFPNVKGSDEGDDHPQHKDCFDSTAQMKVADLLEVHGGKSIERSAFERNQNHYIWVELS